MNQYHDTLRERIATTEAKLADLNLTREQAAAGHAEWQKVSLESDYDLFFSEAERLGAEIDAHNLYRELDQFRESLDVELATVSTRYLITDGKLISPAGFSVGEPVWIKNEVWIETDRAPRYSNLNVYDMHHVMNRNKEWLS